MAKLAQYKNNIGSVSSGTMREEDLIPTFLSELENQKPCKREHLALAREIRERMEASDYFESEESGYDLEALFDALGEYAPEYFYFGAHPGDGADYGYWLSDEFPDYGSFYGLKLSDMSELPSDYYGEFLLISDHGNMSLYLRSRNNRIIELWSIV